MGSGNHGRGVFSAAGHLGGNDARVGEHVVDVLVAGQLLVDLRIQHSRTMRALQPVDGRPDARR